MAEKRDWNAGLNKKGLENSVTEEQAREMCLNQGRRYMFIVEAHAGPKTVNEDGSEKVNLIPDLVELVPSEQEDRIRTFQRALYMARPDQFGQQAFEVMSEKEPTTEEAGAALDAAVDLDATGEVVGIWNGDPDAPLSSVGTACPFPGCPLMEGHEGDHALHVNETENPEYAPTTSPVDDGPNENEPMPNVVSFTHKG